VKQVVKLEIRYRNDVAIIAVSPSKSVVGQSYLCGVNATAENQGGYNETFTVKVYANQTVIGTQIVTLSIGNFRTITFIWNTTGFVYGSYTISAYALPIQDETNTTNNRLTSGQVKVVVPGDVNGDGIVNMQDIYTELVLRFMCKRGDARYAANSDINNDGIINYQDIYIAILHFMDTWP
jgi:hypothetical protein